MDKNQTEDKMPVSFDELFSFEDNETAFQSIEQKSDAQYFALADRTSAEV